MNKIEKYAFSKASNLNEIIYLGDKEPNYDKNNNCKCGELENQSCLPFSCGVEIETVYVNSKYDTTGNTFCEEKVKFMIIGNCGENCFWTIDNDKNELIITGMGRIDYWESDEEVS